MLVQIQCKKMGAQMQQCSMQNEGVNAEQANHPPAFYYGESM